MPDRRHCRSARLDARSRRPARRDPLSRERTRPLGVVSLPLEDGRERGDAPVSAPMALRDLGREDPDAPLLPRPSSLFGIEHSLGYLGNDGGARARRAGPRGRWRRPCTWGARRAHRRRRRLPVDAGTPRRRNGWPSRPDRTLPSAAESRSAGRAARARPPRASRPQECKRRASAWAPPGRAVFELGQRYADG